VLSCKKPILRAEATSRIRKSGKKTTLASTLEGAKVSLTLPCLLHPFLTYILYPLTDLAIKLGSLPLLAALPFPFSWMRMELKVLGFL
jgi:hypothetical protein